MPKTPSLLLRGKYRLLSALILNPVTLWLFEKQLSPVINRTLARRIIQYYNGDEGHQTNANTGNLGFGLLHYSLVLNLKPKRVLCIGSRKGFIPALCALACLENGRGHVDFVDAGYGPDDAQHWSGTGWWRQANLDKHFSFLGVGKKLTPYIMTSQEFGARFRRQYDYIYIDGDHSYRGAKKDWRLFWPRLRKGGLMAFHDITVRRTPSLGEFGVWRLWEELPQQYKITFPFPSSSGLGFIQKP